jgi:hypothetical protein
MSLTPLLKCPFCASHAERAFGGDLPNRWYGTRCSGDVKCPGAVHGLMHKTQEAADEAWNRRTATFIPPIDYDALIKAAVAKNKSWYQGRPGCVAFAKGAEWFRLQALSAAAPVVEVAPPSAEAALQGLVDSLTKALDEAPLNDVLSTVTGMFVTLITDVCKHKGHDDSLPITVDGGDNRDITIHPPKA